MQPHIRTLGSVLFVVSLAGIGRQQLDRDVAAAQEHTPVVITRIFTGPDGLSHAEDIELNLNGRGATEMLKATAAEFSVRPPTAGAGPHNTSPTDPKSPEW